MSDSDYIKASERLAFDGTPISSSENALLASHAAADDVMRELAEALHKYEQHYKAGPGAITHGTHVLARYDRMTGGDDDA